MVLWKQAGFQSDADRRTGPGRQNAPVPFFIGIPGNGAFDCEEVSGGDDMLLIIHAKILTMTGDPIEEGYVVIDPPLIRDVGAGDPPDAWLADPTCQVVDAGGGWLLPGLIDAHCHIGLFDDGLTLEGDDGNEGTDPVTPHLQAIDGIYHEDRCFSEALAAGVTSVMTGPGSANVIGGRFALLHTAGRTVEEMAIRRLAAMKAALGENPKKHYGRKERSPSTRMGSAALLRESLAQAVHYRDEKKRLDLQNKQTKLAPQGPDIISGGDRAAIVPQTAVQTPDARKEALQAVLDGSMILKIHAHRADDILTAVRIADEFGLRYTLEHCTEGYRIVDVLAKVYRAGRAEGFGCGIPGQGRLEGVITGPLLSDRSKPELVHADIRNPAILSAAGIPVAIMTDHPVIPEQYLAVSAAVACREGMDEMLALAAITRTAASLVGAGDLIGTIESGKQADLVLFSGHPFDFKTQIWRVWLDGHPASHKRAEPGDAPFDHDK